MSYLRDPFMSFIYQHLQYEGNRNIIKLAVDSKKCLVYDGKDWVGRNDTTAIPWLLAKYLDAYKEVLSQYYGHIGQETDPKEVGHWINCVELVELLEKKIVR
jgi:hypothetical protein